MQNGCIIIISLSTFFVYLHKINLLCVVCQLLSQYFVHVHILYIYACFNLCIVDDKYINLVNRKFAILYVAKCVNKNETMYVCMYVRLL